LYARYEELDRARNLNNQGMTSMRFTLAPASPEAANPPLWARLEQANRLLQPELDAAWAAYQAAKAEASAPAEGPGPVVDLDAMD